jgi:hypothetical protein
MNEIVIGRSGCTLCDGFGYWAKYNKPGRMCPCAIQVSWDGRTVWVCDQEGATIGRYNSVAGIDIHGTFAAQVDGHLCLDCRPVGEGAGWPAFVDGMARHHGVQIPEKARPHEQGRDREGSSGDGGQGDEAAHG